MKNSKPTLKNADQGKCGVWLDTSELKGKAKQKRPARPISKLLNPFLEGGGYSVAVALNFTQTKLEMPKAKQSSIRSYFAPHRKDVKKMSTSENILTPSAPASKSHSPATRGTKRSRDIDVDASSSEPAWDNHPKPKTVGEEEFWQEQTENQTPAPNKNYEEMIHSPPSKRRVFANSSLVDDEPHLRAWSQDPLCTFSEFSQEELNLKEQNSSTVKDIGHSESHFSDGFQSKEPWAVHLDVAATTSTQKSLKHLNSSLMDNDKENATFAPFRSPTKHRTSNLKSRHSPSKYIPVHPQEPLKEESQLTRTKPRSSPVKRTKLSCKAEDEDSLAMLFTQDSEGLRVIAHGGTRGRSPLKDHSNLNAGMSRMSACKCLPEEMLFTQDSQGNVVIKH